MTPISALADKMYIGYGSGGILVFKGEGHSKKQNIFFVNANRNFALSLATTTVL